MGAWRGDRDGGPLRSWIGTNALEPEWEAVFEAHSYGFRSGRGCHDAIEQCFLRLTKGKNRYGYCEKDSWVLDVGGGWGP